MCHIHIYSMHTRYLFTWLIQYSYYIRGIYSYYVCGMDHIHTRYLSHIHICSSSSSSGIYYITKWSNRWTHGCPRFSYTHMCVVCIRAYMYAHMHTCIQTRAYTCTHEQTHTHTSTHTHTHTHTHTRCCIHAHTHTHIRRILIFAHAQTAPTHMHMPMSARIFLRQGQRI